jgi:hypothetical protein
LHLLEPSVPAPAGTAPETGVREYKQDAGQSSSSRTFCASSCRNRTWNRGHRVHARCWTVLHLLEPFVPALAGTAPETGVREYRAHAGCWTILHLLKTFMPDPAGNKSGTGIREYMKKAEQDLHLKDRSKSTNRRLNSCTYRCLYVSAPGGKYLRRGQKVIVGGFSREKPEIHRGLA